MFSNQILQWLRQVGLRDTVDKIRMLWQQRRLARSNQQFVKDHPDLILPQDDILYETFNLDYRKYYEGGLQTAKEILAHFESCSGLSSPVSILDWGCGPARTIRHMPDLLASKTKIYGADFNDTTIAWCRHHFPSIEFLKNKLLPPIPLTQESIEWIYGISVFTHLSQPGHEAWIEEMHRLLRPEGYFLFTTQGDAFRTKLVSRELKKYEAGNLVIRGDVAEGRRTFSAFHPPIYIKKLARDFTIVRHIPGTLKDMKPEQDIWIVKK